ncbi:hypothetical protein M9458_024591, partial [Cirrhinus mrigala]
MDEKGWRSIPEEVSHWHTCAIKLEDSIWSMDGALDTKLKVMDMLETWEWFRKSPDWIKSKYVLGLLSLCDTPLLH